jgi:flagellar protein FliS
VEQEVLCAGRLELVVLLYEGALGAVTSARFALAAGDVLSRTRAITKAITVVNELATTLDHGAGGALSASLAELYDYIARLLIKANLEQKDEPLAEASHLMATLLEGWSAAQAQESITFRPGAYGPDATAFSACA